MNNLIDDLVHPISETAREEAADLDAHFAEAEERFAATTNAMVSNIIGQGREDEVMGVVGKIVRCSFAFSLILFLVLNVWPEWFVSFYGQSEGFIRDAIPVVRVVSVGLLMMSFGPVWLNAVTGTGNPRVNLWIELVTLCIYVVYVYLVLEVYKLPITWAWAHARDRSRALPTFSRAARSQDDERAPALVRGGPFGAAEAQRRVSCSSPARRRCARRRRGHRS